MVKKRARGQLVTQTSEGTYGKPVNVRSHLGSSNAMQFGARVISLSSVAFAFYMDRQKEERERGVTIACTPKEFYTDTWHCRSFLFGSAPQPNPYWAGYSRAVAIGSSPPAQPLLGTIKHGELIGWN